MTTEVKKIPTGYKQTEIGMIPANWDVVTYDEAFKFLRTAQYSRDQLGGGHTAYVHYGDIHTKWNFFVDLGQDLPTIEDRQVEDYSLITDGDLIMADASEDYQGIGKSLEVRNIKNRPAIAGLHTFLLRDKGNFFAKGYKGYIHANPLVKSCMDRLATGLKVYGISRTNLKMIQVPRPPLSEQSAIASALSDTDALISKLEALIQKKKLIKQGAMQELLTGKRRLPGFSGKWEKKILGELAEVIGGGTPSSSVPRYWNGDINWFTPTEVGFDKYVYLSRRKITEEGLKNSSAKILNKGTILLTSRAGIGDLAILGVEGCTNQGFQSLSPGDIVDGEFLYYLMLTKKNELLDKASGSTFLEISPNNVRSISVQLPSKSEQVAIASILSDMDVEIKELESQLSKYRNLKQGMMQVLLTGKIRLI